jgi:hypothetical protein
MRHRAHPNPIFQIDVEDGVGKPLQGTGAELAEFDSVQLRVLDNPPKGRLELGTELLAQASLLRFVAGGGVLDLLLGGWMEYHGLHG